MDDATRARYAEPRASRSCARGGAFPARDGETVTHRGASRARRRSRGAPHRHAATATPDFPGAIWFTTSCTNKCDVGARRSATPSVNKIVIHDTEGGWDGSVATLQNDSGK